MVKVCGVAVAMLPSMALGEYVSVSSQRDTEKSLLDRERAELEQFPAEEGRDNDIVRETFERTGASVMGKRMFDAGERMWPKEAPFHTPVFVVTHEKRDPWERPGGTTFHFVNDGIEPALDQAHEAAGDRDVRIAGGGGQSWST